MDNADSPLVAILRRCAAAAPLPWYPAVFVRETSSDRATLDEQLDQLRLGGLVQLTDWMAGTGQGYRLTPEGERALTDAHDLQLLQESKLPAAAPPPRPAAAPSGLTTFDRGEQVRNALYDPPTPWLTYALLLANIGVFLWGAALANELGPAVVEAFVAGGRSAPVWRIQHETGALTGSDLLRGEWYRLLTCCFVHLGVVHLFVNMFSLYFFGPVMEAIWGRGRFLFLYLVAGLGGSCAMVLADPARGGAGASGALCGLMGSYVAWLFLNRQFLPEPLGPGRLRNLLALILLNVLISMLPGISASAHFGGAVVGVLATLVMHLQRYGAGLGRWLGVAGMVLLPLLTVGLVVQQRVQDGRWRQMEYRDFNDRLGTWMKNQLERPLGSYEAQIEGIVNYRRERREPARVERALAAARREQQRFEEIAEQLAKAGPYADATVAATRAAARATAAAGSAFYQQAAIVLQADADEKRQARVLTERQAALKEQVAAWDQQWAEFRAGWRRAQEQ